MTVFSHRFDAGSLPQKPARGHVRLKFWGYRASLFPDLFNGFLSPSDTLVIPVKLDVGVRWQSGSC